MNHSLFSGSGCAIVTPMLPDGSLHLEALGRLIDYQLEHSTDAIIVAGTTGEAATLSDKEHQRLLEYTVKKVAGRVPVIGGAGSNCTAHAVELCQSAKACGVDGLLCVTP
ncbi:MAG: dihydrodipicolinate synthase family protein, partial [Oscillospiraceae bacterium]|nr:dihydrodipicolinate synthase family protein [Oscillospiraceae bacterium]